VPDDTPPPLPHRTPQAIERRSPRRPPHSLETLQRVADALRRLPVDPTSLKSRPLRSRAKAAQTTFMALRIARREILDTAPYPYPPYRTRPHPSPPQT
jgi:hypothetical protein